MFAAHQFNSQRASNYWLTDPLCSPHVAIHRAVDRNMNENNNVKY
jgi:hypothetical protein